VSAPESGGAVTGVARGHAVPPASQRRFRAALSNGTHVPLVQARSNWGFEVGTAAQPSGCAPGWLASGFEAS
jgi:hypothetical protein